MTINENNQTSIDCRIEEVGEENELLLLQLHQVQEELERYVLNHGDASVSLPESSGNFVKLPAGLDSKFPGVLAENQRLRALVDIQRDIYQIESMNALNVTLGNLLIEGADSPKTLLGMPGKLVRIWRSYSRRSAPESLGGKGFDKVIAAYGKGGFDEVEKLIAGASISSVVKANSFTALGRHLSSGARDGSAQAARRAYQLDPKPYRLKWLAFRMHEAGKVVEAEAMLAVLPSDTQFSDSELRQAKQLRREAKHARERKAKRDTQYVEYRAEVERRLSRLAQERDDRSREVAARNNQIADLHQTAANLKQEKDESARRLQDAVEKAGEYRRKVEDLEQTSARLEQQNKVLTTRNDQVEKQARERNEHFEVSNAQRAQDQSVVVAQYEESLRHANELRLNSERLEQAVQDLMQAISELEREKSEFSLRHEDVLKQMTGLREEIEAIQKVNSRIDQQKQELTTQHEESVMRVAECGRQIADLKEAKALQEQERLAISIRYEETARQMGERNQEIEDLKKYRAQLEQERLLLGKQHEESVGQALARLQELEALKGAKSQLEQEKLSIAVRHEESVKHAVNAEYKADALRDAKAQLEQEGLALTARYDETMKLVAERAQAIKVLKQANAKLEQEKQELTEKHEKSAALSEESLEQIKLLQRQIDSHRTGNAELAKRQRIMVEEMVRAESQLELVKDMLLREPGL